MQWAGHEGCLGAHVRAVESTGHNARGVAAVQVVTVLTRCGQVSRMSGQLYKAKEHSKIIMIRALSNSSSLAEVVERSVHQQLQWVLQVENCVREYQLVSDALQNTDLRKKITLFKVSMYTAICI